MLSPFGGLFRERTNAGNQFAGVFLGDTETGVNHGSEPCHGFEHPAVDRLLELDGVFRTEPRAYPATLALDGIDPECFRDNPVAGPS